MTLDLESYFDRINDTAIRIRGTRVGIETVVDDYNEGASPEEIQIRYPALTLEQIHATITYYLARRADVDAYVARVRQEQEADYQAWKRNPPPYLRELRERIERLRQAELKGSGIEPSAAG